MPIRPIYFLIITVLIITFPSCENTDNEVEVTCDLANGENVFWQLEGQASECLTAKVRRHSFFQNVTGDFYIIEEMTLEFFDSGGRVVWILDLYNYDPNNQDTKTQNEHGFEANKKVVYALGIPGSTLEETVVEITYIDRFRKIISGTFTGSAQLRIVDGVAENAPVSGSFTGVIYD